jgi:hypothetical protein
MPARSRRYSHVPFVAINGIEVSGLRISERRRIVATAVASYSALPEPMLARSGRLPASGAYAYELTRDGFRAIVSRAAP